MKRSTVQKSKSTRATIPRAKLEKTESEITTMTEETRTARELMEMPATVISPILEAMLRNGSGYEHWGLNE